MNAYKKKLNQSSVSESSNDDYQQLDTWYSQVVDGADLRDRVAVTGCNISRGAFGSISLDVNGLDAAVTKVILDDSNGLAK